MPPTRPTTRFAAVLGAAAVVAVALSACTPSTPAPAPTAPATTPSTTATPSASPTVAPTPAAPSLLPDGSASDNLPYFETVVEAVWAGPERAAGRAYIDALVVAGFDKAAMEVTPDTSTVGNAAESIQFSVRWDQECLVGQVGPATGEPVVVVVPVLQEGTCLVGQTRPIDW
ncbi:hypothetical protein HQM25_08040 [Microbacterium hominis]|uniref:DUF6993 domain-containing protein n=1 Tax=Microbacterium hominis TaxID=162426 RepID=A0A7D4QLS1_9MICO|nr:hypothetical protein HQM25_08040 [Microbacterium hominis]